MRNRGWGKSVGSGAASRGGQFLRPEVPPLTSGEKAIRLVAAAGLIDNVTELFGNQNVSGFAMLAAYDLNADGKIDAADAIFSQLRVWRDADQDGVTDAGELSTLAELGIVSISLANNAAPGVANDNNALFNAA